MIPKIIHQIGSFNNITTFPLELNNIFNNNYEINRDFKFKYYNDKECEKIVKKFSNEAL